jgi:serine/threonine-protein kinase HipA
MNKILAGILTENADKTYTFRYDDAYFSNPQCASISLTLPKTQQQYHAGTLFPFFFNMLTEGYNQRVQRRLFKIDEDDPFGLLMAAACNDVIGAITVEKIE